MGDYSGDRHDKYNMKIIRLAAIAALLLPGSAFSFDSTELEAPNADVYLELQGLSSDFGDYGGEREPGFRARLGLDMHDARLGNWNWRFEGALTQLGKSSFDTQLTRINFPSPGDTQTETTSTTTRVHGFEVGMRLYDNELFYVRAGGFLYSQKTSSETLITIVSATPPSPAPFTRSTSDSETGIAPYAGAGIEYPIFDSSTKLLLEYDFFSVDDADIPSLAAGVQFTF